MTDVRAAAERDAGARAPFLDDRRFVAAEIRVVGKDVADPSEPQSPHLADVGLAVTWNIVRSIR